MISADNVIQLIRDHEILSADTELQPETDLFSSGLDSMAMMQLLLQIEECHGLTVSPTDITRARFATPQALASFLSSYGNTSAAA